MGSTEFLYNGYRVFPGGKERPGRDADPSPPSSAIGHERVRAIPLLPLWAVRPVQSLSACTRVTFTFTESVCKKKIGRLWPSYLCNAFLTSLSPENLRLPTVFLIVLTCDSPVELGPDYTGGGGVGGNLNSSCLTA